MSATIRLAGEDDAPAVCAIYAPFVRDGPITFEVEPPPPAEMARRIAHVLPSYPWLVCEIEGRVVGYAYASRYRERAAYEWSAEVTVYVDPGAHRRGVATALYGVLLSALRRLGYRLAIAAITVPNPASVGLHERLGFVRAGVLGAVGRKHGAWHDVGWWVLDLAPHGDATEPPRPLPSLTPTAEWTAIVSDASRRVRG